MKLADLLDEAEERALKIVSEKNPDLPEAQRREIARVVGLGDRLGDCAGADKTVTAPISSDINNTQALGLVLYTRYVYFFEAAGVILLVAMIGAIVLTLQHKPDAKRQSIAHQVARRR